MWALGKSLIFSKPQFPQLKNGGVNCLFLIEFLGGLNGENAPTALAWRLSHPCVQCGASTINIIHLIILGIINTVIIDVAILSLMTARTVPLPLTWVSVLEDLWEAGMDKTRKLAFPCRPQWWPLEEKKKCFGNQVTEDSTSYCTELRSLLWMSRGSLA